MILQAEYLTSQMEPGALRAEVEELRESAAEGSQPLLPECIEAHQELTRAIERLLCRDRTDRVVEGVEVRLVGDVDVDLDAVLQPVVTIGTRLLVTQECPIHEHLKQALMEASEVDTITILGTLHNTLRAWKNPAALKVADLESKDSDLWEIFNIVAGAETKKMYQEGDTSAGVIACSQSIGMVSEIESVSNVINDMIAGAEASIEKFAS